MEKEKEEVNARLLYEDDFEYSLDCYPNIIVLCPKCHRFMHYGLEKEKREELIAIYEDRAERYSNCGIKLDRNEFLERTEDTYRRSFYLCIAKRKALPHVSF